MVESFLKTIFAYSISGTEKQAHAVNEHAIKKVHALNKGAGLPLAKGKAWGLLNSAMEYIDHHRRARGHDHRRDAAWFGEGAVLKQLGWIDALKLFA